MFSANTHGSQGMAVEVGDNTSSRYETVGRGSSRVNLQTTIRSRVACQNCNHRKVRCDVTRTGIPCSNCSNDDSTTCQVLPRKKHRPRRTRAVLQSPNPAAQSGGESPRRILAANPTTQNRSPNGQSIPALQGDEGNEHFSRKALVQLSRTLSGQSPSLLKGNAGSDPDNSRKALVEPLDADLPDDNSLSYIGDRQGARSFVYDLCHPGAPQDARPSLPPKAATQWKRHEMEYLTHEGAFETLPDDICDDLVRCYFHHVHFFLPIVDASNFLNEYVSRGRQNISPLLFWSMLLAAANYVEAETLRRAGFATRKAMKTAMYERAKCLYDLDHGTDKVTLIQAVMLMGFWYTDPQDHTGAWYWIGIAITLSQTLGLHRRPHSNYRGQRLSQAWQPLVRRIWWTCLVRDRWLSLAKGRPMRICQDDCDIDKPVAQDILREMESIPMPIRERFLPADAEAMARMWISLVQISATLGSILRIHYRVNGPKPDVNDIDYCAEELESCKEQIMPSGDASDLLRLHDYQLQLFYEATVTVLYRPYVLKGPATLHGEAQALWQTVALDRARGAASNTNIMLERIIELDSVHLLKPMIITAMIPAMQIHLFDCKSDQPLRRGLGSNKLNLCMLVLSRLRETYWSASVIHRLFERAQAILNDSSHANVSDMAGNQNAAPSHRPGYNVSNQDSPESEPLRQEHHHQQERQHFRSDTAVEEDISVQPSAQDLTPMAAGGPNQITPPSWLNDSFYFSTVNQLLSPGFSLSESAFPSGFLSYNNNGGDDMLGAAYDQMIPMANETALNLSYDV